jgi:hypothetical protein
MLRDVEAKKRSNEEDLSHRFESLGDGKEDASKATLFSKMKNLSLDSDVVDPMSFAIAVTSDDPLAEFSYHSKFLVEGKCDESDMTHPLMMWNHFATSGVLRNMDHKSPSSEGQVIASAVACKVKVPPGVCVCVCVLSLVDES